jgi:acyl-CoA synthetase (AMP-forming)/AMP-acid ligase II
VRLVDYLDKGAQLGESAPCLTMDGADLSYGDVQRLTHRIGRSLQRSGVAPGDKVAVLSANDARAFACVLGISRAAAVWCPINPRNGVDEKSEVLDSFDCSVLIFAVAFADMVDRVRARCPKLRLLVCLDGEVPWATSWDAWTAGVGDDPVTVEPVDDVAMIAGTGGTTGRPKGVVLTGRVLETMTALTLIAFPFEGRPRYLALAPLTHAAGVLCFPVMTLGGRIVIMPRPDLGEFLDLVEAYRVTHTMLTPTLIYMLLRHERVDGADLSSLQCFWYGAAPMSVARLEEAIERFGPVMAQFYGQTEAPMVVTTMSPREHLTADGTIARDRLASAGRPGPLVQVGIMDGDGRLQPAGGTGEIVVRGSLVMAGYYRDPAATAEAGRHGWHHTGDIGRFDEDGYLYVVDRAKDMIITGGFNVYSVEVEQALLQHPAVADTAVVGLPDDTWGERVTAVLQLRPSAPAPTPTEVREFVKERLGGVKAPKQVEIWPDLPRSRLGKVLKGEVRTELLRQAEVMS